MAVRVRFAPSPTGPLHLGSAVTAVANDLFARHAGGSMVLRIDDTDAGRSERRFESVILQDADWLGLHFDEGPSNGGAYAPYRQSERGAGHTAAAAALRARGLAYPCFCEEEELERARRAAEAAGHPWRYDGGCDSLPPGEAERRLAAGEPAALRFRAPATEVVIDDAARGAVRMPAGAVGDFVLVRSDGIATYNFATAVDDAAMQITHVIRGEDHMSNTARQLMILAALELRPPRYGHCALLLDGDGHKLTASRGAESIADLRAAGYPPEAIVNYAALLACPPGDGDEVAAPDELAARFSLARLSKGVARFDRERLDWVAQQHINRLAPLDLASRVGRVLTERGLVADPAQLAALVEGLRGAHTLAEAADEAERVIRRPAPSPPEPDSRSVLALFADLRAQGRAGFLTAAEATELLAALRRRGAQQGKTPRELLPVLRRGLTGADHGMALQYVVASIDRDEALARCKGAEAA